jgi:hypothetical protein
MTIPVITLVDAKSRIEHHKQGLMEAWSDYYAGAKCTVQGNDLDPHYVHGHSGGACLIFYATKRKD